MALYFSPLFSHTFSIRQLMINTLSFAFYSLITLSCLIICPSLLVSFIKYMPDGKSEMDIFSALYACFTICPTTSYTLIFTCPAPVILIIPVVGLGIIWIAALLAIVDTPRPEIS